MVALAGGSSKTTKNITTENKITSLTQLVWMGHCSNSVLRPLRFCVNDQFNDLVINACRDMSQRSVRIIAHVSFSQPRAKHESNSFLNQPEHWKSLSRLRGALWSGATVHCLWQNSMLTAWLSFVTCVWREFTQSIPLQKTVKVDSLVLQQEQNKFCPAYQLQLIVCQMDWNALQQQMETPSSLSFMAFALLYFITVKIYFWKEKVWQAMRTLCCSLNWWAEVGIRFGGL